MQRLIEAPPVTEQILTKLGLDFIRRYELKQQFCAPQFNSDSNRLIEQLRLYSNSIRQIRNMPSPKSQALDQKFHEVIFRVMLCMAKLAEKLSNRHTKDQSIKISQTVCDICCTNLNAKQIKNIQRQIFQYFPILGREDIQGKDQFDKQHYEEEVDHNLTNQELIVKKMVKLQRNLHDKQLGLMRSIQQFEACRNNMLVGLPKYSEPREGYNKFNIKEHVFQLSKHFTANLKEIDKKISNLKIAPIQTESRSVQCIIKQINQNDVPNRQIDTAKMAAIKLEAELRKSNEARLKWQQMSKRYQVEIKHLNTQINELQDLNRSLRQDLYVQKLKKGPRQKHNRAILIADQGDRQRRLIDSKISIQGLGLTEELQFISEISSQLAEKKSQIQSSGVKMEEVYPIIKSAFKKVLDKVINKRLSTTFDRKRMAKMQDSQDEDSVTSHSIKKFNRSSFRGLPNSSFMRKSKFISGFRPDIGCGFAITSQVSHKIVASEKRYSKRVSSQDDKFAYTTDQYFPKGSGKSLYKRSTLQTEGNLGNKKLHVKLSSIASDIHQNQSGKEISQNIEILQEQNSSYNRSNTQVLQVGQSELTDSRPEQNVKLKKSKNRKKITTEDFLSMLNKKSVSNILKVKDSFMVKKINNKKIDPRIMNSLFNPQNKKLKSKQKQNSEQIQKPIIKIEQQPTQHSDAKSGFSVTASQMNAKKPTPKKAVVMKLDELSYLTVFFALMAKSHLTNPSLYAQLRACILEPCRAITGGPQKQESMIKQLMGDIISKHRKCGESSSGLCRHLSQFLVAFSACVEVSQQE